MIVLIDNKDYMIRLCENSEDIHGFDSTYPHWEGLMRLNSDIGMMSVVSGKEAEDYLDENHIYYIHIEDEGESYKEFLIKLLEELKDNEELINSNMSYGKLIYGITDELEDATIETNNILEIWRYHEDGRYYLDLTLFSELKEFPGYVLKSVCDTLLDKTVHDIAPSMELEELAEEMIDFEGSWDGDFDSLFSADSLREMIIKLAVLLKSIYTGEYTEDSDETKEESEAEEFMENTKEKTPIITTYYGCVKYNSGRIEKVPFETREEARRYISELDRDSYTQIWTE